MDTSTSFVLLVIYLAAVIVTAGPLPPSQLLIEYLPSPAYGIDVSSPRFSWTDQHTDRGQNQSNYQIQVSTSSSFIGGMQWDSSKVASAANQNIDYQGKPLKSATTYYWRVRWWDSGEMVSGWSVVAQFDTGLFNKSDWSATWIGGKNQLRKEFKIAGEVTGGRLYIVGLGYYVAYINGQRVSNNVLGTFTTFQKRVLYDTFDVTSLLNQGNNAIAVTLGNGWYAEPSVAVGPQSLLAQLYISYADGKRMVVVSDTTWKTMQGPITMDDIYIGENYDARMETPGWNYPNFNDSEWKAALPVKPPSGVLSAQLIQPIQKIDTYTPVALTNPVDGIYVFDMGQNMAGWCKIKVLGQPGTKITLTHSEMVYQNGLVQPMYPNSPMIDTYILKGDDNGEEYEPTFTYHGFRYVQVEGWPGVPNLDSIQAYFIHTALPESGEIVTSDSMLNQIQHLTRFASLSNFMNIPTDCPQRERRGWLGDAQLSAETTIHNWNMAAAYTKFLNDIRDSQLFENENGAVPDCVPFYDHGGIPADPAWGTAYTLLWWWMYKYYGDTRVLQQHYTGIKQYVDQQWGMTNNASNLLTFTRYGDWCSVARSLDDYDCDYPSPLVSSFYMLLQLETIADVADLLGYTDDATNYSTKAKLMRNSWNQFFYDQQWGYYFDGFQTSQVLSLVAGLVTSNTNGQVVNHLLNDITNNNNNHLTTGIVGTKYLLPLLTQIGRNDLAYTLAVQTTYPSWGYMVLNGGTTLWETWYGTEYTTYGSRNHIMFGSQSSWYYQALAGINMAPGTVGWESVVINPTVSGTDLSSVAASIRTNRGLIASSWNKFSEEGLCDTVLENSNLTLSCTSGVITKIDFASFGTPNGQCGNFTIDNTCNAANTVAIISKACIGQSQCVVLASDTVFGDPCPGTYKRLYAQVSGCSYPVYSMGVTIPVNSNSTVIIPKLGLNNVIIMEGSNVVWKGGKFVGGTPGVYGAQDTGSAISFQIGSGNYLFQESGQPGTAVCGQATHQQSLRLKCPKGKVIRQVEFASFGDVPSGSCGNYQSMGCSLGSTKAVVEQHCLHRSQCTIRADVELFGGDRWCAGSDRTLTIHATCAE